MLKALGWFLFLAFDAAIVVWFVMPHGDPPTAPTIPPPSPTELAVAGNSVGGINAFSFNYANDMARTDGTRNAVFSPLTTYAQLILLERAANYRSGRQDSNAVRESSRLLEQLASDPALTFAGELTVSRDIGIDEWLAGELKRYGMIYAVDPAKLASSADRFPMLVGAAQGRLCGLWRTSLRAEVEWEGSSEEGNDKDIFTTAAGKKVRRFFQDLSLPASTNLGQAAETVLLELSFDEGLSLFVVMPRIWDADLALTELEALSSGKRKLQWCESLAMHTPVFWYNTPGYLKGRLARMGYIGNYESFLPFLGTKTAGRQFETDTDASATAIWDGWGFHLIAETTTAIAERGCKQPLLEVTLDHPYLYALRHEATGVILGIGWVVDPVCEKME